MKIAAMPYIATFDDVVDISRMTYYYDMIAKRHFLGDARRVISSRCDYVMQAEFTP